MCQEECLEEVSKQPVIRSVPAYMRLCGPGYVQSAMTLGAGTLVAGVLLLSAAVFAVSVACEPHQPLSREGADVANETTGPYVPLQQVVTHNAMGTEFSFTLYTRPGDAGTDEVARIADEAFAVVDDLDARLSRFRPDSQTTYLNNHAAAGPVKVAPDILDLVLFSREIWQQTGGAFDITVGPVVSLWGFYKGEGRLPSEEELRAAVSKVGLEKVEIDREERTVHYTVEGMSLDFGGIAKGLALDKACEVLKRFGVGSALLNAGTSTVVAVGAPPGKRGWTVRIRHPYNKDGYVDEVVLRDESLSTSGSYENFFELGGKKYCHIFVPETGKPVEGMLSASAIAPSGIMSDALSTAFFVMGNDKVQEYCVAHPTIRAIMVPVPEGGGPRAERINSAVEE